MEKLSAILIECDNVCSLGGSCERDIYNIYKMLTNNGTSAENIYILTNNSNYFIKKKIMINLSNNSVNNFEDALKKINNNFVFIHISGHGYQGNDQKNIELDSRCEQIVLSSGALPDYNFNALLMTHIPQLSRLRISIDTCHSGTFSNFNYQITKENKKILASKINKSYFTDSYSISACGDNQLDSCDVGAVGGFGGGLTCHILDNNNLIEFLLGDPIKVLHNLVPVLKLLNQEPILLTDN